MGGDEPGGMAKMRNVGLSCHLQGALEGPASQAAQSACQGPVTTGCISEHGPTSLTPAFVPLLTHDNGEDSHSTGLDWTLGAFSHSAGTAPIITLLIPGAPLKTTHLRKHA